ncbi:MAG: bifunctional phosphoglucose/phosphomannose isomerase [Syntrophomonas sp.]
MHNDVMMRYLWDLPGQFEYGLAGREGLPNIGGSTQNIVITGMGGSAIGGDIIRSLAAKEAQVPVVVNRGYEIPRFVGPQTLFLAVTYSGNTEETLSSFEQARKQGAQIVCLTSGGQLKELAGYYDYPCLTVPEGLSPRAATGYLFAPLALLLEKNGLIQGVTEDLQETVDVLYRLREQLNPEAPLEGNYAREAARLMKGALPIIWGSTGLSETVAFRWKAQINENAKSPAYWAVLPELNHNEIMGFDEPRDIIKQLCLVILRDSGDHPRVVRRIEITKDLIKDKVQHLLEVQSSGHSWLARFYSLVYIGDYASTYLALEYGKDPVAIEAINHLKAELAK